MVSELINANPIVYEKKERRVRIPAADVDEYAVEPIDQLEIFDILSERLHCILVMLINLWNDLVLLLLFWISLQN